MLLLVSRLAYLRTEFCDQVCDTLSALGCSKVLGAILADPEVAGSVKVHTLAIINRALSAAVGPGDVALVARDIFPGDLESGAKAILQLLRQRDTAVASKSLLLVGLLSRVDRKVSEFWSASADLKAVLSSAEKSQEADLVLATKFCKKWVAVV
jgi:hypothetical protein